MWLDQFLSWLVLLVPVILGVVVIVVPAKKDDEKIHMRWRLILGIALIAYGGIAWWQQSRSASAAKKDQDEAVKQTSAEVTKNVTQSVTQAVGQQYEGIVKNLTDQIGELKGQLAAQGKNVDVIKNSNIVTGKNPLKVEVTNSTLVPPAPVLTGIRIASQKTIASDDPNFPFGLEVVVQTDVDIAPVKLAVVCDGPIGKGQAHFEGGGVYTMMSQGLAQGNDQIFVFKWDSPAWTSAKPVIVNLFSKTAVRAVGLSRNVL